MSGAGWPAGLDDGFDDNTGLVRNNGLGLWRTTKKKKTRAARASNFAAATGFASSGCFMGVAVVTTTGFLASWWGAWGRCDGQIKGGSGLDHGDGGGLGLALPKSKLEASRGLLWLAPLAPQSQLASPFCHTTSARF